jgi:DNA-binding response OmpR family regulator
VRIPEGPLRRVLIVDDCEDTANSLAFLVGLWGFEAEVCYDGAKAVETAATFLPQVVFLDLGLPGMDGFEVALRLRKMPGLRSVLLVAVTGWQSDVQQRLAWEAGFDHYVIKPADTDKLRALLGRGSAQATVIELGFLLPGRELEVLEAAAQRGGLTIGQLTRVLIRGFLARIDTRRISPG